MTASGTGAAPGWFPDPTGRHQYRYWGGATWTDNVADNGVAGTDPLSGPGPATGTGPGFGPGPGFGAGPGPGARDVTPPGSGPPGPPARSGVSSSRATLLVVAGVVALVAVVAAVFLVVRSGGDDTRGEGTFAGEVTGDGDLFVRELSVPEDSVVVLRVEPDADFDVTLGISTDDEALADRHGDFFAGSVFDPIPYEGSFLDAEPPGAVLYFVDPGGSGDAEELVLPAPFGGDFSAVVGGFSGSTGEAELDIAVRPFAGPEGAGAYVEEFFTEDFTG